MSNLVARKKEKKKYKLMEETKSLRSIYKITIESNDDQIEKKKKMIKLNKIIKQLKPNKN
jgi:uncharacterized Zn finger protein (UPF0148 family)